MPGTLGIMPNYGVPRAPSGVKGGIGPVPPPPRGYGVLAPRPSGPPPARGVTRAPRVTPQRSILFRPLPQATRQNMRTGGQLGQYRGQLSQARQERQVASVKGTTVPQRHEDFFDEIGNLFSKASLQGASGGVTPRLAGGVPSFNSNIFTNKIRAAQLAMLNDPSATVTHSFSEIPSTLGGMVAVPAQAAGNVLTGHPERAMSQLVHGITKYAYQEYGSFAKPGGVKEGEQRYIQHGLTGPATDAFLAVGGAAGGIGRLWTASAKVREAAAAARDVTTPGRAAFEEVKRYRDARDEALKHEDVRTFLEANPTKKPSLRTQLKAASYESATQPRPLLRQSAGQGVAPARFRGATLRVRSRSPNYFRAVGQTATDALRRHWDQESLARVMDARQARAWGEHIPRNFTANQLAFDTARGEVTPLFQHGNPLGGHMFLGAERAQRISESYGKAGLIRLRNAIEGGQARDFTRMEAQLTPEQKQLLAYAKEGRLSIHDPAKGRESLQIIHDNARHDVKIDENGKITVVPRVRPVSLEQASQGMDVARETQRLLSHIDKVGAESVFTPDFAKLVEMMPDEKLVSHANPRLTPDIAEPRRYGPQMQDLKEWAARELASGEPHHDAAGTFAGIRQIEELEREGHEIRSRAVKENDQYLHDKATDKFHSAKNLADEIARSRDLPTDRAYLQHTAGHVSDSWLHTIPNVQPKDYQKWEGKLQAAGVLNRDPEMVFRAFTRSLRDEFGHQHLDKIIRDHAVQLPKRNMNGAEIDAWLRESGRDPANYVKLNLGGMRQDMFDWNAAEHLDHLNADPEAHQKLMEESWSRASAPRPDDRGLTLIPKGVHQELTAGYRHATFFNRSFSKAKATLSKWMLRTSIPWMTVMSAATYPTQSLAAGAGPFGALAHFNWYKGLSASEKATFDHIFGVDDPYSIASHGISAEHMGSAQTGLETLVHNMKVMRASPMARWLSHADPIAIERIARRYGRINPAVKGLRSEAIRQMVSEMRGTQVSINDWQVRLERLLKAGRLPPDKFMKQAMQNTEAVERIAERLNNTLGEWHGMTQFERNYANKFIMFYPWVRYSSKLAFDHLPTHHPLLYSLAYKMGEMEHEYLKELIGTEPKIGTVYLGNEQPNVAPQNRNFSEFSLKQANPLLNFFTESLGKQPLALFDAAPPYLAALIEYMVGKNLFTGKPLKGPKVGESKEQQLKNKDFFTELLPFLAQHGIVEPISPLRVATNAITGGKPQAAGSLPLAGLEKPVQYSTKTENKIRREGGTQFNFLKEAFPFLPQNDKQARAFQIKTEKKESKETRKNKRKEEAKKHKGGAAEYYNTPGGEQEATGGGAQQYYETSGAGTGGPSSSYYEKP